MRELRRCHQPTDPQRASNLGGCGWWAPRVGSTSGQTRVAAPSASRSPRRVTSAGCPGLTPSACWAPSAWSSP